EGSPAMTDLLGKRLGDFEIVRELGHGGMGVVFEARQVSLNRRVALKVLSGGFGLTSKALQRFRREAEAAAKLHHTNIVPVYPTGEVDDIHFYAMELMDGASLAHVLRQLRQASKECQSPEVTSQQGANAARLPPSADLEGTGPYVPEAAPCRASAPHRSAPMVTISIRSLGWSRKWPTPWTTPTEKASSTATSGRPTCCYPRAAG